jgi:DNA-binding protein Alba
MSVFVGKKPLFVYSLKAMSTLKQEKKVVIAARGALISKAILVVNRVVNQMKNVNVSISYNVQKLLDEKKNREKEVPVMEFTLTM